MKLSAGSVIVVEDCLDQQCVRHMHLMSNTMIADDALDIYEVGSGKWKVGLEAGVWHYRARQPYRGVIDIPAACKEGKFRRLVVWSLNGYTSVKVALYDVRREYCRLFGGEPKFAFVRKMPKSIEHGHEIGALMLLEAEWMLERAVAVGGKG